MDALLAASMLAVLLAALVPPRSGVSESPGGLEAFDAPGSLDEQPTDRKHSPELSTPMVRVASSFAFNILFTINSMSVRKRSVWGWASDFVGYWVFT